MNTVTAAAGNSLFRAWKIAAPTMTSTSPAAARGANQGNRWTAGGTVRPKAAANSATPMNWRKAGAIDDGVRPRASLGHRAVGHREEQAVEEESYRKDDLEHPGHHIHIRISMTDTIID